MFLTFLSFIVILYVPMLLILCLKLFFFDYLQVHGRVFQSHKEVSIVNGSEFRKCNLPSLVPDVSTLLALGTRKGKITGVDFHNETSVETATMMLLVDILRLWICITSSPSNSK